MLSSQYLKYSIDVTLTLRSLINLFVSSVLFQFDVMALHKRQIYHFLCLTPYTAT